MNFHFYKKIYKRSYDIIFIFNLFSFSVAKKAAAFGNNLVIVAQDTSVTNNATWGESITTALATVKSAISTHLLELKEYVLDGLAWTAANVIIDKFADSLVTWIQSGFQGGPMFLSDRKDFSKTRPMI